MTFETAIRCAARSLKQVEPTRITLACSLLLSKKAIEGN